MKSKLMPKSIVNTTVAVLSLLSSAYAYADTLQFSAPTYTVDEQGVTASITVTRVYSSVLSGLWAMAVDYSTSDGSATAGSDYLSANGSLTFGPGVTSQTFTIDIIDDGDYEGDETINLALSNPTPTAVGATLGDPVTAVLTIVEDEPPPPGTCSSASQATR